MVQAEEFDIVALPRGIATGGDGKSNLVKLLLSRIYQAKPDVGLLIIDPEGEYAFSQTSESNRAIRGLLDHPSIRDRVKVFKMLKWWRDERFGDASAPRSIVIEALVGKYMPDEPRSDAEAVVTTLERMQDGLGLLVPYLPNSTNWIEDFARDWRPRDYGIFRRRVAAAAETARRALAESDTGRSARRWREIFGETFPA